MTTKISSYQVLNDQSVVTQASLQASLLRNLGFGDSNADLFVFPRGAQSQLINLVNEFTEINVFSATKIRADLEFEGRVFGSKMTDKEISTAEGLSLDLLGKALLDNMFSLMRDAGPSVAPIKELGEKIFPTVRAIDWAVENIPAYKHLKMVAFPVLVPATKDRFLNVVAVYDRSIIKALVNLSDPDQNVVFV